MVYMTVYYCPHCGLVTKDRKAFILHLLRYHEYEKDEAEEICKRLERNQKNVRRQARFLTSKKSKLYIPTEKEDIMRWLE